jgi:diguanylate cyclase (GGDEF)-like protein
MASMNGLFDNVQVLALMVQSLGAGLISLLCLMLDRVVRRPALAAWSRGWSSLGAALVALLVEQAAPVTAPVTLPLYLFGEYLFAYWIIEGCVHFGGRTWHAQKLTRVFAPLLVFAVAVPQIIGYEFRAVFIVQSLVLCIACTVSFFALSPAATRDPASPGLLAMRSALLLLAAIFLAYVPVFGANVFFDRPLPMTLLRLSSVTHLVLEFLLGFGGAVLVLEQSHQGLAARNSSLALDNERFRIQAERDALTGTYNRHAFFQFLEAFKVATVPMRGCVAMIDLDGLKQLNDNFGHITGDMALVRVAQSIQRLLHEDDKLFRWGGDEFLLIAPHQSATAVAAQLEALNPLLDEPGAVSAQVSYGMVEFGADGDLFEAVKRADLYMYERKRSRNKRPGMVAPLLSQPGSESAA